jgi:hypothetical protein
MKRLILLSVVLAVGFAAAGWRGRFDEQFAAATASWTPAELNPIAWYKGDGDALDAMGNYDGTWVGTEAYADGPTGQAFDLDGSSYINCGNVGIGDEFTVALWVKGGVQPGSYRRLITKGTGNETGSWQVHTSAGTLSPFVVRVDSSEQFNASHPVGNLLTEEWVHLALVFSKANSTIQVFLGGGLSRVNTVKYGTGITNNTPFTIASNASGANPLLGKISDVLIFDRALTPEEVELLYNESVKRNGRAW